MSRRRYVSTQISQDTRVNRLAVSYGDFAALLYTWMIPHAADDATLPGDPEELLYQVLPGRRDKSPEDVQAALDGMVALGLVQYNGDGRLMFPPVAFYRYQTYIKDRNKHAPTDARESAQNTATDDAAQTDSANQRKSAQNTVSFSPSFKSSPSLTTDESSDTSVGGAQTTRPATPAPKARAVRGTPAPETFPISDDMQSWADEHCPDVDLIAETQRFLDRARAKGETYKDWRAAWRNWMTSPYAKNRSQPARAAPAYANGAATSKADQRLLRNIRAVSEVDW